MTKPPGTKERFIELRASGMTLARAAEDLNISKNTAVNWKRDLRERIDAVKAIKLD